MDTNDRSTPLLASPLAALRGELAGLDAPPGVEQELMQAFARQFPPKRRWHQGWRRKLATPTWSMGASAAGAALVALLFVLAPGVPGQLHGHGGDTRPAAGRDNGMAFIALDSLERIEQEPAPRMVATEVPRTALAPLGLPVTPENAGDSVMAEMLVGADGHPLALRLSSID
jgi:hypothetical protein